MIRLTDLLFEESPAAEDAKRRGLKSAGWGKWKDPSSGEVVATTKGGKLVLIKGKGDSGGAKQGAEKPARPKKGQGPPQGRPSDSEDPGFDPNSGLASRDYGMGTDPKDDPDYERRKAGGAVVPDDDVKAQDVQKNIGQVLSDPKWRKVLNRDDHKMITNKLMSGVSNVDRFHDFLTKDVMMYNSVADRMIYDLTKAGVIKQDGEFFGGGASEPKDPGARYNTSYDPPTTPAAKKKEDNLERAKLQKTQKENQHLAKKAFRKMGRADREKLQSNIGSHFQDHLKRNGLSLDTMSSDELQQQGKKLASKWKQLSMEDQWPRGTLTLRVGILNNFIKSVGNRL